MYSLTGFSFLSLFISSLLFALFPFFLVVESWTWQKKEKKPQKTTQRIILYIWRNSSSTASISNVPPTSNKKIPSNVKTFLFQHYSICHLKLSEKIALFLPIIIIVRKNEMSSSWMVSVCWIVLAQQIQMYRLRSRHRRRRCIEPISYVELKWSEREWSFLLFFYRLFCRVLFSLFFIHSKSFYIIILTIVLQGESEWKRTT